MSTCWNNKQLTTLLLIVFNAKHIHFFLHAIAASTIFCRIDSTVFGFAKVSNKNSDNDLCIASSSTEHKLLVVALALAISVDIGHKITHINVSVTMTMTQYINRSHTNNI